MFHFFDWMINFFENIWVLLQNFFLNFINMINILTSSVTLPFFLLPYVPSFIYTSIALVVSVGVIKLVLGWGNS